MPGGWSVERHTRLGSTNDRAKELARSGALSRSVVVAREQTGGRGRGDHAWASPSGGLYASILLRALPVATAPLLALVAALALRHAVAATCPDLALWVKWPNDLLAGRPDDGRPAGKAAGILVETAAAGDRLEWAVLGFGVNVAVDPRHLPEVDPPAVTLGALSARHLAPEDVLHALLDALDGALDSYADAPDRLVADVERVLAYRDSAVQVRLRDVPEPVVGRLLGLARDGALRLDVAGGERRVAPWDAASLRPAG